MVALAESVADLATAPRVRACLEWLRKERAWINDQHPKLCRTAAPTFFEQKRAEWFAPRGSPWETSYFSEERGVANRRYPHGLASY
jgi:hypothetical protein